MAVRVVLTDEAIRDLDGLAKTGKLRLFLSRLLYLEEAGADAGKPLRHDLLMFRRLIVGDRNWRIVYQMDPENTVATVWVIGDRRDDECYVEAAKRLAAAGGTMPEAVSLAKAMQGFLNERRKARRR